jgi:hypothetical protein
MDWGILPDYCNAEVLCLKLNRVLTDVVNREGSSFESVRDCMENEIYLSRTAFFLDDSGAIGAIAILADILRNLYPGH